MTIQQKKMLYATGDLWLVLLQSQQTFSPWFLPHVVEVNNRTWYPWQPSCCGVDNEKCMTLLGNIHPERLNDKRKSVNDPEAGNLQQHQTQYAPTKRLYWVTPVTNYHAFNGIETPSTLQKKFSWDYSKFQQYECFRTPVGLNEKIIYTEYYDIDPCHLRDKMPSLLLFILYTFVYDFVIIIIWIVGYLPQMCQSNLWPLTISF